MSEEIKLPSVMSGVLLQKYGSIKTLKFSKKIKTEPLKKLKAGQVIVKLSTCSLTNMDILIRKGSYFNSYFPKLPHILGKDGSGVIIALGPKTSKFKVGDRVFGMLPMFKPYIGTNCQYTIFDEKYLIKKPEKISDTEASALTIAGLAAYQALVETGKVKKGSKVFINGGSGGVGHLAVQLAKSLECKVYATCSTEHVEYLKELGCDVVIDYTKNEFFNVIREYIDVAIDCFGNIGDNCDAIMKNGKIINLKSSSVVADFTRKFVGFFTGSTYYYQTTKPNATYLEKLVALVIEGKIKVKVDKIYKLNDLVSAHLDFETKKHIGKYIIDITNGSTDKKIEIDIQDLDNDVLPKNTEIEKVKERSNSSAKNEKRLSNLIAEEANLLDEDEDEVKEKPEEKVEEIVKKEEKIEEVKETKVEEKEDDKPKEIKISNEPESEEEEEEDEEEEEESEDEGTTEFDKLADKLAEKEEK